MASLKSVLERLRDAIRRLLGHRDHDPPKPVSPLVGGSITATKE